MVSTERYDLNTDNTLGGDNPSDLESPSQKAVKEYVDSQLSGEIVTDVQINGTSITSNNVANIVTESAYDESTNKIATMSDVPDAQVNSDWNATSGKAQILNKPNLAAVATSGSYNDLLDKPTIDYVAYTASEVETLWSNI